VGVENGGPIHRVQVKSTIYCRRGDEHSLNVMGPGRKRYEKGTMDFFAVWVIPNRGVVHHSVCGLGEEFDAAFHTGEQAGEIGAVSGGLGFVAGGGDSGLCGSVV
jgi:hypothetical protein